MAELYLRTADYIAKRCCGIYEIISKTGRKSYKIFIDDDQLQGYLKQNKDKKCTNHKAVYRAKEYREFPNTQIRKLTKQEAADYWHRNKDQVQSILNCDDLS